MSGARADRPGLAYALAMLESGQADALVVSKLDRLGRTVTGLAAVIEHACRYDWSLIALDMAIDSSTSGGRLVMRVLAALAEWEREQISERTRDGLAAAKAKGIVPGPKSRVPIETTQRIAAPYTGPDPHRDRAHPHPGGGTAAVRAGRSVAAGASEEGAL